MITYAADRVCCSMMEKYKWCTILLKQQVLYLKQTDCIMYREYLVAKYLSQNLNASLSVILECVNYIKTCAMRARLFSQMCEENVEKCAKLFRIQRFACNLMKSLHNIHQFQPISLVAVVCKLFAYFSLKNLYKFC